ncbi:hypothetical protein Pmar_PMAR013335 [Perkinsus marinus ATCC 50983]|uniref:Uncharacterized protein n=1 Tax=Perkinsus marinus (strain ATCC 50983 / TXsc) TaxID=423536 RepID=C5L6N4_PERM5|nr:hypothetical protein Pmar_PMAR013335 [Perkinsus marinus ATCC 50983]EER07608.1 hypothetical protein Pmar_PMAR013335 [Perkinsus marinus ATCC 50983]|eukprot:XP_002775792.1 hypothetical protein Pmar_PMAR013335 [Perkinsus marinus ATCC 50983]
MNAAIAEASRIRKLAPELGVSVQNAFGSAAEVALTEENSIEMLEVDNPVSKDQTRSLLGIFSYVGILPSSFQSCASSMASGTFGSDKNTQVAIQEQAEDVKVYTEVPTGMDSEKSAKQMWNLIDGAMLTNCASRASINSGDIPMMEVQQASDPGSAPTTHKSASLPWYAWLLIAIGIVIVIAACVYVWWLLSSRRKQREKQAKMSESCEGAGEGSSERGLISGVAPATGYVDDDAATATVTGIGSISTHARLPSSATHRASVLAEVPTAVVSVNPDGSLTPRLPLAPKNPAPKSSISLIASTPNSHPHWDTTRSHEAPY